MSTIRYRSPASYFLALPAAIWMIVAVIVPIVLIVWVSFWGGRRFDPESPLVVANYVRFFSNQSYLNLVLATFGQAAMLMLITGVLGYAIAYFLTTKVTHRGLKTFLFFAFIVPFWTSAIIRAIAWIPFLGTNGVINSVLTYTGITNEPVQSFLYSMTGITMAQVSLYTLLASGPVVYMLRNIPRPLPEAAMTLKAPPLVVFWRVIFPLSLPGIVVGQVLVFLNVMADFATVAAIGGNKQALLGNLVLLFYEAGNLRYAAVIAVILMICMLIGVAAALRVVDVRKLGV